MCWKPLEVISQWNLRRCWTRLLTLFGDWVSLFPVFRRLSLNDRVSLLSAMQREQVKMFIGRFTQCTLFLESYRTYLEGSRSLLLGSGVYLPSTKDEQLLMEKE